MRRFVVVAALAFATCAARHATAQPQTDEPLSAARHLFEEGLRREDAAQWAPALTTFQQVAAVKVTPQVTFHIAFCLAKLGRLIEAAREFEHARSLAKAMGDERESVAVVARAEQQLDELYARTPRLIVRRADGSYPDAIVIDGAARRTEGEPVPLDPGHHHVVVERPGAAAFETEVAAEERRPAMLIEVSVPAAPIAPTTTPEEGSRPISAAVLVAAGVSVAAFGGAVVTALVRASAVSNLERQCGAGGHHCPSTARSTYDRAVRMTTVTDVLLGIGAASAVAGVTLWITTSRSPARTHDDAERGARPWTLSLRPGGVWASTTF
jgi:hypothetical protein